MGRAGWGGGGRQAATRANSQYGQLWAGRTLARAKEKRNLELKFSLTPLYHLARTRDCHRSRLLAHLFDPATMLRRISLLALILLLAACKNSPPPAGPVAPPPPPVLPDVQCFGELPAPVAENKRLENYRLAQEKDFVASIRQYERQSNKKLTCSIFTADFNGDGLKEYALLLVNKKTSEFRFELLLNRGTGDAPFGTVAVRNFKVVTNPDGGFIYTAMTFKPAKELGPASRSNFPLKPGTPERQKFVATPAIELWRAPTNSDGVPKDLNLSTLAYCSDIFYFVDGKLETVNVCD
jgi:hypothetical protein